MNKKLVVLFSAICLCAFGQGARAQFAMIDATVDADLTQMQADTLAPMLTGVETTATQTTSIATNIDLLTVPTVVTGVLTGLDGGASTNMASQTAEFLPMLNGTISVSPTAKAIELETEAYVLVDETKGEVTGNTEAEQNQRERLIATNLQGQAQDQWDVFDARFAAADTMLPTLSAQPNLKQVAPYAAALKVETLKSLYLVGQAVALNTTAVAQGRLDSTNEAIRIQDDHKKAVLELAVP